MNGTREILDAVIIGAGLSGLIAARELRDWDILVLEKEDRAGGRILTRSANGLRYELGAVFAPPRGVLPAGLRCSRLLVEEGPLGVWLDGEVHLGADVMSCLSNAGMDEQERQAVLRFCISPQPDIRLHAGRTADVLNAFFQVIHPGCLEEYLPGRRRDALARHPNCRYEDGNGALVAQLAQGLGDRLMLSAEVLGVKEEDARVWVTFRRGERVRTALARVVIVSTPAPTVLRLLDPISEPCRSFLRTVRYGEGTVVAVGIRGRCTDFSYIVTPGLPTSTILRQCSSDSGIQILLAYYAGSKSAALKDLSRKQIVEQTLGVLRQLDIAPIAREDILFSDVQHWPSVGPVISAQSYAAWDPRTLRPSDRIFLCGDYLSVDPRDPMPYGIAAALSSGRTAAAAVSRFLGGEVFASEPLVEIFRYELTTDRPVFRGKTEEGNLAMYGVVLQATRDPRLKRYLLDNSRGDLWEWQPGFGVTAEDSALVIDGLFAAGVPSDRLLPSLRALVEGFFSSTDGAFQTISNGRAPYWHGPSPDATAQIGYLLSLLAPSDYRNVIEACAGYLHQVQHKQGYWRGKWFPSLMATTYYAVRFLRHSQTRYADCVQAAEDYILSRQGEDGSWGESVIDTSTAVLALGELQSAPQARETARRWLRCQRGADGWSGEPVLYYWYQLPMENKLFFHCVDKGRITTAWARLALGEG